jgi:hypothetical protein
MYAEREHLIDTIIGGSFEDGKQLHSDKQNDKRVEGKVMAGVDRIIHPLIAGLMLVALLAPIWSVYYSDHYVTGWYFIWYSPFLLMAVFPYSLGYALYSLGFVSLIILGLSRAVLVKQWVMRLHMVVVGITLSLVPATAYFWQVIGGLFAGFWLSVGLVATAGLAEIIIRFISHPRSAQ